MALSDTLRRLKLTSEPAPPPSTGRQIAHLLLSLAILAVATALIWMILMSEVRLTYTCDAQHCMVWERDGLFAKPLKIALGKKPVTLELQQRPISGLSVLMIDADGESQWITPAKDDAALARRVATELKNYRDGDSYLIERSGFGIEWFLLAVLLITSCVLNLRTSLRWFLHSR